MDHLGQSTNTHVHHTSQFRVKTKLTSLGSSTGILYNRNGKAHMYVSKISRKPCKNVLFGHFTFNWQIFPTLKWAVFYSINMSLDLPERVDIPKS
jgi:hypothetical protein